MDMMSKDFVFHSPETKTETFLILIADDEVTITEALAVFVADLGYVPMVAYNGQEALALASERWPRLVITDLMMPLLNGADLIHALRAEAVRRGKEPPPVILLTAAGIKAVKDLDVAALILKPFDLDHLEQVLHRLLGNPLA